MNPVFETISLQSSQQSGIHNQRHLRLGRPGDFKLPLVIAEVHPLVVAGGDETLHGDRVGGIGQGY